VQGCPFRCRGCLAPDWIPPTPARAVRPADLAAELLAHPGITGLTFSGGEPMEQAAGLAEVIKIARQQRDLTLICFTGYRLAELRDRGPTSGVAELLAQVDVLVDGRYVAARNDDRGLRGSSNQRVHLLTGRLADASEELAHGPRRAEIRLRGRSALLVGVPSAAVAETFERVQAAGGVRHEG
jgi:anaerobic ribonucleoside-triphosphate reductase activating protein